MAKRTFDILVAALGLTLLSPLFVCLAIAVKLESTGPVFYRGLRVGRHGVAFRIYKFRSMIPNAESIGASSTSISDLRLTRIGRWMRKYKLDELPQLINVLTGDMSFVGPRPEVQKFVDLYTPEERKILTVRPGITDWSSMKFRNEGEIIQASGIADPDQAYALIIRPEKLRLQMKYIDEQSMLTDIKIIFCTLSLLVRC